MTDHNSKALPASSEGAHKPELIEAARHADWQQVVRNGGPPCFRVMDDGHFCFRAERWCGHGQDAQHDHPFVTLAQALATAMEPSLQAQTHVLLAEAIRANAEGSPDVVERKLLYLDALIQAAEGAHGWQADKLKQLRNRIVELYNGTQPRDVNHRGPGMHKRAQEIREVDTIHKTLNVVLSEIDALLTDPPAPEASKE